MISLHEISVRKSCQELKISRTVYNYKAVIKQEPIELKLMALAEKHPKYGCRKLYQKLRQQGEKVNHKKVRRLYMKNNLKLRLKSRKKLKVEAKPLPIPKTTNQVWAMDFTHDRLDSGSAVRSLNIIDLFSSKAIDIYVDRSINSYKVLDVLEKLKITQGLPKTIISDNGKEFRANLVQDWAKQHNIDW